jgi:hypothetical protein
MRIKKLIKTFEFLEKERADLTLGSEKIRLNPGTHYIQLTATNAKYNLDSDIFFKTKIFQPSTVKQWLGFQADINHKLVDNVQVTSAGFRLSDGTDQYYWNGSSWEVNTTDWNTEGDIAVNITSFDVTPKKIQIICNLKTTDKFLTPELIRVKVLWGSNIEFEEDLIYKTLIPSLKENIRPIADLHGLKGVTGSTIDLNDYNIETPYDITEIDSVYNITDDSDQFTNLYSSYDINTKIITLTGSVDQNKTIKVRFYYKPNIAVNTSQDYLEVGKVPSIILDDIDLVNSKIQTISDNVINKGDNTAVKVLPSIQGDLDIQIIYMADKQIDLTRLGDEIKRYFIIHRTIRSVGLDEEYDLYFQEKGNYTLSANREGLQSAAVRCRIKNVNYIVQGSQDKYAIQKLNITGMANSIVE